MKRIYSATKGARFSKKKAQVYGKCLEAIEARRGKIEPEIVVEEARSVSSPLHSYFDWDDTKAAEKYRTWEARSLINHLTVVVNYETGAVQKAFFNVSEAVGAATVYVNIERALTEPQLRKQVLENALRELLYWKGKYQEYSEFKGIVTAIAKVGKWLRKKKKK